MFEKKVAYTNEKYNNQIISSKIQSWAETGSKFINT